MGFEKGPKRPPEVTEAIRSGDTEKIRALGRAGGIAAGKRREESRIRDEISREMQEAKEWEDHTLRPSPAEARRDDLLPED